MAAEAAAEHAARKAVLTRRRQHLDRLGVRPMRRLARFLGLSKRGRQTGALAVRRRLQTRLLGGVLLLLNVIVWFIEPSWAWRALVLVASVLVAPVLYTVLFRKA